MRLLTLALLVVAGTVRADVEVEVDLQQHLSKLASPRYPIESNTNNRNTVKDYIYERMKNYGLEVQQQKFNTTIDKDPLGLDSDHIEVQGTNVIGIQRALTHFPGAVVVVGADYDSNGVDDPLFHNGAGVAALLEVARAYSINERWSGRYVANYTTIFVAFDINTKLHQGSPGHPGAYYFVQNWLMPFLKQETDHFGGAVILDSIMNVNYEDNSQTLSNNFENAFPDTYTRVQQDNSKGNFLAMVSMGDQEATTTLRDQFSGSYRKNRRAEPYRLEDMKLHSGMKYDNMVEEFVKSDNIHFWKAKDFAGNSIALPALLLTDTKSFRRMKSTCITDPCRPIEEVTEERTEFVEATVEAVTTFLFNRQATLLPEQSSGVSSLPSAIMTGLMLVLVRLYM